MEYKAVPPYPSLKVTGMESGDYRVEKIRFADKATKDCIIYNGFVRVKNLPAEAYKYCDNIGAIAYRGIYAALYSEWCASSKTFDIKILFDFPEEYFDLPTFFVDIGDRRGGQTKKGWG